MKIILAALIVAATAACSIQHRATDPAPTLPALTEEAPLPAPESEPAAPQAAPPQAAAPADAALPEAAPAAAAPSPAAVPVATAHDAPRPKRTRVWGRVAITTAVVSPSQLMGPVLAYAPDFRRLSVFPEKMVLDVSWGMISVGEATLSVNGLVMFNGRPAYHLVNEARSNSFCDTFYPVRDLNESWLDARTLTSLGYSKKIREGRYFRDVWVLYDRDSGTFVERQTAPDGSFRVKTGTIPVQVQDVLSSIYYTRAQPLPEGGQVIVDVNTPENWPLVIQVIKRETIKVPAGRMAAVLVEPAMRREGLFIQKGKHLQLWLSDDPARRLLMMKVEVFFGHITAVLREMV